MAEETKSVNQHLGYGSLQLLREPFSKVHSWYSSLTPAKQTLVQNVVIWAVVLVSIWWASRGVSFGQFFKSLKQAKVGLFVSLNVGSFFLWWLGETYLFKVLFNFFHERKTSYRELLPATAAQYFLQAVNILAADGALVVFLNRRKGVRWLTAMWTMAFQGFIDVLVLSSVIVAGGVLVPSSPIRKWLPYAGGVLAFLLAVALWWARGSPKTGLGRWLYHRPGMKAFREAGLRAYLALGAIRFTLIIIQLFVYYYSMLAFTQVPLIQTLALGPGIQAASNEPVTPQGLGPLQAVVVGGLSKYAPRAKVLAAALGISIIALLCRLPLGLSAAGTFARRVLAIEASDQPEYTQTQESATSATE
jgi:hypothetical protein